MKCEQSIPILHLITTLDTGGAEIMLAKLFASMDKHFDNRVVSLTDIGSVGKKIIAQGIRVYTLNMPRGHLSSSGLAKLWRIIRSLKPTILQTWLYHADLLGLIFGRLAGIKNICWNIRCSNIDLAKYRSSTKWTLRFCSVLSPFPDVIITNSRQARDFHIALGYRASKWEVIPNGFDLKQFRPNERAKLKLLEELGLSENKEIANGKKQREGKNKHGFLLIGLIARYDPMKDHSTFIKAACLLLQERRDVHFILAGKDVKGENKSLAKQIPEVWKDHFHLLGERNDIPTIAAGIDIATLSSYGEGFSNAIGEAMACGVPCVVTDVGDSGRLVGDTGKVVPPKDPYALAASILELLELSSEERQKLGQQARERICDHYSLDRIVGDYENLYHELASR